MKKIFLLFTLFVFAFVNAQILEPVKWTTSVKKTSENEAVLIATATIDNDWHLYSQNVPEDGPIATTFSFDGNKNYLKKGNTLEETGHTVDDPIFNMKIKYFANKAVFKQPIKLKAKSSFKVIASVEFMVCDNSRCLPPTEIPLTFEVN